MSLFLGRFSFHSIRPFFVMLAIGVFVTAMNNDFTAEAAKKKASGPDPAVVAAAELKKNLDPISDQLIKMMMKVQSRELLSPADAGALVDLKYKLLDVMNQFPQNPLLAKPVYQAGVLFAEREEYNDAYELFNYLAQGYAGTSYGAKAKMQVLQLDKRFGADYFSVEAATAPATPSLNPTAATGAAAGSTQAIATSGAAPASATASGTPGKK